MKNWTDYFSSLGLLTQKGPTFDGGDTPSHEGLSWLADYFNLGGSFPSPISYKQYVSLLVNAQNILIRNPQNYNTPSDTSRDQYRSFVIADYFKDPTGNTRENLYQALPRNFLGWPKYPNGDLFTVQDYTIFKAGKLRKWYLRPIQLTGDLFGLLGVLTLDFWTTRNPNLISRFLGKWFWIFIAMNPPNADGTQGSLRGPSYTSDDLGAIEFLVQGKYVGTFLSSLSRWVYGKFRPNGPQWALDSYFGADEDPPVNEICENMVKEEIL